MKKNSTALASQMLKLPKSLTLDYCGLRSLKLFVQDVLPDHNVGCRNTGKNTSFKCWLLPYFSSKSNITAITSVTASSDICFDIDIIIGNVWLSGLFQITDKLELINNNDGSTLT